MDNEFSDIVGGLAEKLLALNLKLAVADSCTGGLITCAVGNHPRSSEFLELSVVSSSMQAMESVLGVSSALLRKHGMVSEEAVEAMAEGACALGHADVSLSITGIPGPGKREDKDPGLFFVAASVKGRVESEGRKLEGDTEDIKRQACLEALRFLSRVLDVWL
jgi:PncC family amidohydrolase